MANEVKILLAAESEPQMDALREFMGTLDPDGQKSLLNFFQGAKFMQNLMRTRNHPGLSPAERPGA